MSAAAINMDPMTPEELEALGEEIATFAARVDVATHAMLTRLRTFDAHEGWGTTGMRSCAHWLSWRTGIGIVAAREKVRVARALGELTKVDGCFARGELSYSKVRAIVRVATAQSEQDFLDIAKHATASQLETLCRGYERSRTDRKDPPLDQRRYVRRRTTRSGMTRIEIQLPPEEGNVVWEALGSALDSQPPPTAASHGDEPQAPTPADAATEPSDPAPATDATSPSTDESCGCCTAAEPASSAMPTDGPADKTAPSATSGPKANQESANGHRGDSAESAPSATCRREATEEAAHAHRGDSAESDREAELEPELAANDSTSSEERRADAIVDVARGYLRVRPRTLGAGYELVVVTTPDRVRDGADGIGGFLRDGTPLPLHIVQSLASDAGRVDVSVGETGALLDVGRRTRQIPPSIARALWLRDGGCRFPGCTQKNHLRAHHIVFWMHGGPTSLENLVLLCNCHHGLVHQGLVTVRVRNGEIVFTDHRGRQMPASPPTAATGADLEELEAFLREADVHLDPSINAPRWDGTPLHLDDALSWMFIADETRSTPVVS